jgi:hypothetical protein
VFFAKTGLEAKDRPKWGLAKKRARETWLKFGQEGSLCQVKFVCISFKNRYKGGGVAQAVKCLPSKCEALSSNPVLWKQTVAKCLQNVPYVFLQNISDIQTNYYGDLVKERTINWAKYVQERLVVTENRKGSYSLPQSPPFGTKKRSLTSFKVLPRLSHKTPGRTIFVQSSWGSPLYV